MVELSIETKKVYEDEIRENCTIKSNGVQTEFKVSIGDNNVFIKTPNQKDKIKHDIPPDCLLELEVTTTYPDITVDIPSEEVKNNDNVNYDFWQFESTGKFEDWFEKNNLKLIETA